MEHKDIIYPVPDSAYSRTNEEFLMQRKKDFFIKWLLNHEPATLIERATGIRTAVLYRIKKGGNNSTRDLEHRLLEFAYRQFKQACRMVAAEVREASQKVRDLQLQVVNLRDASYLIIQAVHQSNTESNNDKMGTAVTFNSAADAIECFASINEALVNDEAFDGEINDSLLMIQELGATTKIAALTPKGIEQVTDELDFDHFSQSEQEVLEELCKFIQVTLA
ncbi:hypothetical protein [Limosilactobacillus ingluviei]|nr:hypothetical protein [Limosilactobacillus ingluviei]